MIVCNETVAAHFNGLKIPFIYRTHEPPEGEKAAALRMTAQSFGLSVNKNIQKPETLQKLLEDAKNKPGAYLLTKTVLFSLPQARYTHDNPAHYGLASVCYTHFTSPIRRYPDLMAHRIIKEAIAEPTTDKLNRFRETLPAVCAQCSRREREAESLERDVEQLMKVQFMRGKRGQEFSGVVSGASQNGLFVSLPNTVEGMVPAELLRKWHFSFDKDKMAYINKKHKQSFRPGDAVSVTLQRADEEERRIYFSIKRERIK
jgi:ribonuclease R